MNKRTRIHWGAPKRIRVSWIAWGDTPPYSVVETAYLTVAQLDKMGEIGSLKSLTESVEYARAKSQEPRP